MRASQVYREIRGTGLGYISQYIRQTKKHSLLHQTDGVEAHHYDKTHQTLNRRKLAFGPERAGQGSSQGSCRVEDNRVEMASEERKGNAGAVRDALDGERCSAFRRTAPAAW